jgi:hypothetical protein
VAKLHEELGLVRSELAALRAALERREPHTASNGLDAPQSGTDASDADGAAFRRGTP